MITEENIERLLRMMDSLKEVPNIENLNKLYFEVNSLRIENTPDIKTQTVDIDMGNCRIQFYNYDGSPAVIGEGKDIQRNWLWQLISDKIDSKIVRSVQIPELRYDTNGSLNIKVEVEV